MKVDYIPDSRGVTIIITSDDGRTTLHKDYVKQNNDMESVLRNTTSKLLDVASKGTDIPGIIARLKTEFNG